MLKFTSLKAALVIVALTGSTLASAGSTGWLNRDNPGGSGDWENAAGMVTGFECQIIATGQSTVGMAGYTCSVSGSVCQNTAARRCQDTQVRFTFDDKRGHSHVTPWLNRDNPGGTGDWELFSNFFKVNCRFTVGGQPITTAGPAYTCGTPDSRSGGIGLNAKNGGKPVQDFEVEFVY
ncbi:MAG: hypothetical protein ABL914_07550 [Novosphingobium sp.]|uniref:hypothetical protein n=1 Tax=Novosphingobium sp. TaxID=1874826 RepID=UPI0032BE4F23